VRVHQRRKGTTTGMATDHTVGYLALVREFDGKPSGISVNEFLYQVNEVGQLCNWNDLNKITIARLKMTGLARLFRDHTDNFNDISVWVDFCKIMKHRFIPVSCALTKYSTYINASQQSKETIFDFATRLSMLYNRAHKPPPAAASVAETTARLASKSQDIEAIFLRGLKDKNLAQSVMNKDPPSLQAAIQLASNMEANRKHFIKKDINLLSLQESGVIHKQKLNFQQCQRQENSVNGIAAAFAGPSVTKWTTFSHSQKSSRFVKNNTHDSRGGFHSDFKQHRRDSSRERHDRNSCDSRPHGADSHPLSGRAPKAQRSHIHNKYTACYICGETNHYAHGCAHNKSKKRSINFTECYRCGAKNHFANACTQHLSKTNK
jgi:Zinc knuckle